MSTQVLTPFLNKLNAAPPASFHVLDPAKAARMRASTLYIPSVLDVAGVIQAIPKGETRTILALRQALAALGQADTACPAVTIKYWKWLAHAAFEIREPTSPYLVPWWRVLKDGKLSPHLPGGVDHQRDLLGHEGVHLRR